LKQGTNTFLQREKQKQRGSSAYLPPRQLLKSTCKHCWFARFCGQVFRGDGNQTKSIISFLQIKPDLGH